MSLDRLINLARRTGDRLIVHQPDSGEDVVIMDVDEYELLLEDRRDVRGLSDKQLLDQINRDIAIWRANDKLEEDFYEDYSDDESEEDEWFSAGSVLGDRYDEVDEWYDVELEGVEPNNAEPSGLSFGALAKEGEVPREVEEKSLDLAKNDELKIVPNRPAEDSGQVWEEESLGDDEPVFYEEPV